MYGDSFAVTPSSASSRGKSRKVRFLNPDLGLIDIDQAGLEETARELNVPYLNLLPTFSDYASTDLEDLFLAEIYQHYSPAGNALVAASLDEWLARRFPRYPPAR